MKFHINNHKFKIMKNNQTNGEIRGGICPLASLSTYLLKV
jgi:hypothetical protein